jgi:tRNA synthetases class II (D, K and N)
MCSGSIDKYYQIARCFRDEDGRKDRQPEFTQIDLEMAYVSWGQDGDHGGGWRIGGSEIRTAVEGLLRRIWKDVEGIHLHDGFPVMTYNEAMSRVSMPYHALMLCSVYSTNTTSSVQISLIREFPLRCESRSPLGLTQPPRFVDPRNQFFIARKR